MVAMKIALSADSSCDLNLEQRQRFGVSVVPFTIVLGEKTVEDGEISLSRLFRFTEKTGVLPRTCAVNVEQCVAHFRNLLKKNDQIIHIAISSAISSAYENACAAAGQFPGKVHVIDSKSLCNGVALLVAYARELIDTTQLSARNIAKTVASRASAVECSFALESVEYLHKGGRCSAMAALGANLLKLRPQIIMKDGAMIAGKKFRGPVEKWTMDYVEETLAEWNHPDRRYCFLCNAAIEDEVLDRIEARLRAEGFKEIIRTEAGATIACHCGPHCLGIFYFNDGAVA